MTRAQKGILALVLIAYAILVGWGIADEYALEQAREAEIVAYLESAPPECKPGTKGTD